MNYQVYVAITSFGLFVRIVVAVMLIYLSSAFAGYA
jgi:hypothetical protein